jgi:catechol 2,3-dioxygenase-like lactoylglutathione lyase family enzyme
VGGSAPGLSRIIALTFTMFPLAAGPEGSREHASFFVLSSLKFASANHGRVDMDTIEATRATERQGLLSKLPSRLHHNAFVVKDHEINRRFFEDLLGIPLVATWCEKNFSAEMQREVEFCHTFYAMADGGALAFFQFADPELYEMTQAEKPAKIGRYDHIAFKAEPETYEELKRRLERAGEKYRETNHGYCKSIYVSSPDGLIVEFTQDPDDVAEIDAIRRADAHQELARWLSGDRRTNNDLRGRAI